MRMPPILRRDHVRLIGVEHRANGVEELVFSCDGLEGDGYIRISIYVVGEPGLMYSYTIRDRATATVRHYRGKHGDPEKDDYELQGH